MLNERAKRLVAALPAGFEAALIQTDVNRFYFLDFDAGDAGTLLILPERMVYVIDSRYIESAQQQVKDADLLLEEDALAQVAGVLSKEGVSKLYLEDGITLAQLERNQEKLPNVEFISDNTLSKNIQALREIKSPQELARMRRAQQVTDACFTHILPFIKEGAREVDIMLEMEHYMRSHGAEKVAFDTICVGGPNTSLPHGVPGDYRLRRGDFITLDFGAKVEGYCADMTRTVALGEPGEEKRKVYDWVLGAHLAGIAAVKAGAKCADVDAVARDIITAAGYGDAFGHGLGHAVGIEIHENPRLSRKSADTLAAGMTVTVEPGIYLAGCFGCRIEDTVHVTAKGCEPLPASDKQLIVL